MATRLFLHFSAGDARTGSGLELAICHEISEALEGEISLTKWMLDGRVVGPDAVVRLPTDDRNTAQSQG